MRNDRRRALSRSAVAELLVTVEGVEHSCEDQNI